MSKPARTTLRMALCLALGGVALSSPGMSAQAGPPQTSQLTATVSPAKKAQAKARFTKAKSLYKAGKYRAAIEELEAALKLDPEGAELVYNLGVIHEKLTEVETAAVYYRQYIDMIPDEAEKDRVREILKRIEGAKKEIPPPKASAEPDATAAPVSSAPKDQPHAKEKKGRFDGYVITAGLITLAGVTVGTVFGVKALVDKPREGATSPENGTQDDLNDQREKANREALIADISFFGVAAVAGITGILLYFGRDAKPEEAKDHARTTKATPLTPSVSITQSGFSAGLGLRF